MSGWRFFLVWMLTFLGFPVGGALALLLVESSSPWNITTIEEVLK